MIDPEIESRLNRLSPAKRALLLAALHREAPPAEPQDILGRRPGGGPAPLSPAQQRLWFLWRMSPHSGVYNVSCGLRIGGSLDIPALAQALDHLARRQESLRTVFPGDDGNPRQVVEPAAPRALPLVDLSALPPGRRVAAAEALAAAFARAPFDLEGGPVWRRLLQRLAGDDHRLIFALHHIVCDGWSQERLLAELAEIYASLRERRPARLPALSVQYADYAVWQRARLQGGRHDDLLAYWRQRLAGAPLVLDLPGDRPRPALASQRGGSIGFVVPPAVAQALHGVGRRHEATPFMTCLTAFAVLLAALADQDDLLIGSPVANRRVEALEPLIGCFANTLVMRCRLAGDLSFAARLTALRDPLLDDFEHQDLPFEALLDTLAVEREMGRSPLFQVAFALHNLPPGGRPAPRGGLELLAVPTATAKFDLTLALEAAPGGEIAGAFEYASDLFDAATVERLARSFGVLLAGLGADPDRPTAEIPWLTPTEVQAVLREWNDQPAPRRRPADPADADSADADLVDPVGLCLHDLFSIQALRRPAAIAVCADGQLLTYGALAARAAALARRLRALGVGPEVRVAVFLDRSPELIVAVLGVLMAGGAYVPLDTESPPERLAFILADSGARVVLSRAATHAALPPHGLPLVALDAAAEPEEPAPRPPSPAGGAAPRRAPAHAAYVIYTSGSTGRPKGVVVTHANAARLFTACEARFDFTAADVWTLFHSIAFDFSVWELWGALLHGGRLVIVPYLVSRSPADFLRLLAREGVTVLNQTPSAFRQLIAARAAADPPPRLALRWVIFGGEALDPRGLHPWIEACGDETPRLVNMYGITETTVHVTWRRVRAVDADPEPDPEAAAARRTAGLGAPLSDLRIHLLDRHGRTVPRGVPGEILVGGAGVARGYLGRPELTAERFVPDRWSAHPGGRLYRSGDRARYGVTGELEYLGRTDHQVKIRGFRIELGEVEAALAAHPAIGEAVVVVRPLPAPARLIACYTAAAGEAPPPAAALRSFLEARLPSHMVPATLAPLAALPLTGNGKVDRRALLASLQAGADEAPRGGALAMPAGAAPRTLMEETLAAIWGEVLERDEVGVEDNFFALGGDSILSLRVLALAQGRGVHISLPQLFRAPTLADLAREAVTSEAPAAAPTANFSLLSAADRGRLPAGVDDAYPLSFVQAGMLYHMEISAAEPLYHNVDSWHLRAPFAAAPFLAAIRLALGRHEVLRTSFDLASYDEPLQLVHRAADLVLPVIDLRRLDDAAQERLLDAFVAAEKRRLLPLGRPPLLRFHVHLRADDRFQLTLTENHAVWDGWSLHSTLAEIFGSYLALRRGAPPPAEPPIALRFRDFVARERQALASPDANAFWDDLLAGAAAQRLPRRRAAAESVPATAALPRVRVRVEILPEPLRAGLRRTARGLALPLKSLLLAAHFKVLSLVTGDSDLISGLVSNGRPEEVDGERLRGLFLNTLPMRLGLASCSWAALARQAFDAERRMLPHRLYPGAELQRRHGALFEVAFNYIHFHAVDRLLRSGEVEVLGFRKAEGTNQVLMAHFDHVALQLEYDAALLDERWIERLSRRYLAVLQAIVAAPEALHDAEDFLSPEDLRELARWQAPPLSLLPGLAADAWSRSLPELFAAQAAHRPRAVAVRCAGGETTYGELAAGVRRLAARLRALGVTPEGRVGVCLERSADMVAAVLAVLAAGGAYVPLDPSYPAARLAYMVADSGLRAVITAADLAGLLPAGTLLLNAHGARLDGAPHHADAACGEPPPETGGAGAGSQLAYVIYTSGSTGQPKGVEVTQRGVVNLLEAMRRRLGWSGADETLLAVTSLSFDIAGLELFLPLATGARIELATRQETADGELLLALLAASGATVMQATPATWSLLLDAGLPAGTGLRAVCGGEALPPGLAAALLARGVRLWNVYGPTETTIWSAARVVTSAADAAQIGRPIEHTRLYVLDERMVPVPVGVVGEVWLAGRGVARGYHDRPGLTARAFRPDPWSDEPGMRMYRTGDLGRWRDGAGLELIGRNDHQVKIRGYRIECGDIEAVLRKHPGVRQAAVITADNAGEPQLVGYIVPRRNSSLSKPDADVLGELRPHLRAALPDYMVPSLVITLPALPLTPNAKVDRTALPAPVWGGSPSPAGRIEPRNAVEAALVAIWTEILAAAEPLGVHDNVFAAGGQSLTATRFTVRVADAYGVNLPVHQVFANPTIAALAEIIAADPDFGHATASTRHERNGPGANRLARRLDANARRGQ